MPEETPKQELTPEASQTGTSEEKTSKKGKDNAIAILSYLGILFLVPMLAAKDNDFAQYHAKQGLVLFIAEIATMFIAWILLLGWFIGFIAWIVWVVFSIIGIVNVLGGKKKPLPIIGQFAKKLNI